MKLHPIVFPALALAGAFTFAFAQEKKEPNFTVSPDKIAKIDASLPGKTPAPVGKKHEVGSSRVDLQACKLEYSIVSPK